MFELNRILAPPKLRFALRHFGRRQAITVLDVGCGNHSPALTKHWFPHCQYHGADIQRYNLDERDLAAMDRFWEISPSGAGYVEMPDGFYDLIVLNHVLEHMNEAYRTLGLLTAKLKKGGMIYAAFPSVRSLGLPSAQGTLQFCDDSTHVFLPTLPEVANVLLERGIAVVYGGAPRDFVRLLLGIAMLPLAFAKRIITGRLSARGLWFVYGFEDCVVGIRRGDGPPRAGTGSSRPREG